jgi:hypothetical protein
VCLPWVRVTPFPSMRSAYVRRLSLSMAIPLTSETAARTYPT